MQVEHKTEMGTLTFFLPPSGAGRFKYFNDEKPYLSYFVGAETFREYFPLGTVLIGLTSEVTEEQAKMMVDKKNSTLRDKVINGFKDYLNEIIINLYALPSFRSLMQFKKVYEVNPYEYPIYHDFKSDTEWANTRNKWQQCQLRTGPWLTLVEPNK